MDKFITLYENRFHYIDTGGNKPVLLWLHGLFGTAYSFAGIQQTGITEHIRAIVPTLRGRGQSDKPSDGYTLLDHANDIVELMDALGLEAVLVAGHGFGGQLAAYLAFHYPDRVEKLVLVDTAADYHPARRDMLAPMFEIAERAYPFVAQYLNHMKLLPTLNGYWDDAVEQAYLGRIRIAPHGAVRLWADANKLIASLADAEEQPWHDMLSQIELPTLLLNSLGAYGKHNEPPMLPRALALESAEILSNSNYLKISGNHTTMLFGQGAIEIAHAILKFGGFMTQATSIDEQPFRFFDNREKYLMFVTTTSEKSVTAARIGRELERIKPTPPAIKIFDAGMGNGTVLSRVLREAHCTYPNHPFVVVGKEISMEDTRLTLDKLADRFFEHPQMVVVITNLYYAEAPWLQPRRKSHRDKLQWWNKPLKGNTAHDFSKQIAQFDEELQRGWQTKSSTKTGNPLYVTPSVMVIYREDQAFALHDIIPKKGFYEGNYDLVMAAQPYRSRMSAEFKVDKILAPLARSLNEHGRMIVIQSTGHDPGMEIIRKVWPEEEPFATPRHMLISKLKQSLNEDSEVFAFDGFSDDRSLFTYHLHALPDEIGSNIGTSTLLAAWNAAVYVAQIEDDRFNEKLRTGGYLEATKRVLQRHGGLWFQDESFVVVKLPQKNS